MKILLTGATGFIGSNLLKRLKKDYDVLCLSRKHIAEKCIVGSLEDVDILQKATKNIDIVLHLAAETRKQSKDINNLSNIKGTRNLIKASKHNSVKKFIFTGTVNASLKKRGAYGESKKLAEELIKKSGLPYIILRLNLVYGEGDKNLSKTIKLMKKLPFIPVLGKGDKTLQPVYVDDVVDAIMKCIKKPNLKNKTYNLAGPRPITFNEYIDIINEALKIKKIKVHVPIIFVRLLVSGGLFENIINKEILCSITQDKSMDIKSAKKDLGFNPKDLKTVLSCSG